MILTWPRSPPPFAAASPNEQYPRKALPLVESAIRAHTVLGKDGEGEPGPLLRTKSCHQGCLLICIKGGLGLGMGLQPCPSPHLSSLAHSETRSSSDLFAASEREFGDPIGLCLLQDPCLTVKWLQAQSGLQAPESHGLGGLEQLPQDLNLVSQVERTRVVRGP